MLLERYVFDVKDLRFDKPTRLENGTLYIDGAGLKETLSSIPGLSQIDLHLVKPGEASRIIHVLDTIMPMAKDDGRQAYPGNLGPPDLVGNGITRVMPSVAVMECAALPWTATGLLYAREAMVDMTGPYAGLSPFSETLNLVLEMELEAGKSDPEYDHAVRTAGLKAAAYVAQAMAGQEPDRVERYDTTQGRADGLPSIAYVYQVQNQGPYSNTLLYGKTVDNLVPTVLDPNELLDGALVSGNYVWPCFKVPTYLHAMSPVVLELYKGHGRDHNFAGVVFSRGHNYSHFDKTRSANIAAKLVRHLGAQAMVITWEGGGNAATDAMLTIQACEKMGIRSAAISFEFGGPDGTEGILLVDDVPEADALVSSGSIEKPIELPRVERAVGGPFLRLNREMGGEEREPTAAISFDNTTLMYCAANQTGFGWLIGRAY
ncbi:MAG: glycine/sarcosine/betaine reductase component B subunit [Bacillota bacterium]